MVGDIELALSLDQRRRWIDPQHPHLTLQRQCELLGVPRSTFYHQPRLESPENLRLLRKLDELYLIYPFFGSRRMAVKLAVGRTRARRLMRVLGIEAHYPKRNLSRPAPGHEIYRGAASRSSGPTRSGAPTLNTFRCMGVSSAGSCHGLVQPLRARAIAEFW